MCLKTSKVRTKKLHERIKKCKDQKIKAWKIVTVCDGEIHSMFYQKKPWKAGVTKSTSRRKVLPYLRDYEYVDHGIHVYLKRPNLEYWQGNKAVLTVWGYKNDLIAVGTYKNTAVFTKVTVTKNAIKSALNQEKERVKYLKYIKAKAKARKSKAPN